MALSTYNDLLTAIQNYEDDATAVVTDVLADMVTLAEQRIFYGFGSPGAPMFTPALRTRSMEKTVVIPIGAGQDGGTSAGSANAHTVTLATVPTLVRGLSITFEAGYSNTGATTLNANALGAVDVRKGRSRSALEDGDIVAGGAYTVYHDGTYFVLMPSDGACPLPARFLGVKAAYLQDRGRILTPMPASGINTFIKDASAGEPCYYAIEGDCLRFDPLPDADYSLSLTYYAKPAALSSAVNDIFSEAPGIYLYAALLELALYLPNDTMAEKMLPQYLASCISYQHSDRVALQSYAPGRVRFAMAP
jgi:hypothetical protein